MEDFIADARQERAHCADFFAANPSVTVVVTEGNIHERNGNSVSRPIPNVSEKDKLTQLMETQAYFINAVEKLALMMNPPNAYTPRFLQMCIDARRLHGEIRKRIDERKG